MTKAITIKTTSAKTGSYFKMTTNHGTLALALGNAKLADDTLIMNMGTATDCPSKKRGLCGVSGKCYALKAERLYPSSMAFRTMQANYWEANNAETIINDLDYLLNKKRVRREGKLVPLGSTLKAFRFNESGDFYTQDCISKLDKIAAYLKTTWNVKTYGYSARRDLNFDNVSNFVIRLSFGMENADTSKLHTMVIKKEDTEQAKKSGYFVCPGSCKKCTVCSHAKANVVFPLH